MDDLMIEFRKNLSKILKDSKNRSKRENCLYCGKLCKGFCNSHTVPQFVLKNIISNGEIYNFNALSGLEFFKGYNGLNNAGTFHLICRECDGSKFAQYENKNNYKKHPSNKMLAEIAVKNFLKSISKRDQEIEMVKMLLESGQVPTFFIQPQIDVKQIDLEEFIDFFERAKRISEGKSKEKFNIIYYNSLDYVVPIAIQFCIAMLLDINNDTINDTFDTSEDTKMEYVHLVVFPLETSSIVCMFMHQDNLKYHKFKMQLENLPEKEQLQIVNNIIIKYCEDFFISKDIKKELIEDTSVIQAFNSNSMIGTIPMSYKPTFIKKFDISKKDIRINFLSSDNQIL